MKTTNVELEELIISLNKEMKELDESVPLFNNITVGDLKIITERMLAFVDFCKFELGEEITNI